MREPYEEPWGEGGTFHGLQTVPREAFVETVRTLHDEGWRVATHAVGDAAIDLVLDKAETQLTRHKEKLQDHRGAQKIDYEAVANAEPDEEENLETYQDIVNRENFESRSGS